MTDTSTTPRITIAIIDDDVLVGTSLRRLCEVFGWTAKTYTSGHEFLASLVDGDLRPDCLLLDAHMPQMTGEELLQHLTGRGVHMPTIVCTADDTPEVRARYVNAGFVAYLQKPIGADRLRDAIERAVRRRNTANEFTR